MNRLKRRDFFASSVSALAVTSPLGRAAAAEASPKPKEGCLAIGTYGLQSMPLGDAVGFVAETGFDAVEITVFPGTTGDPTEGLKTAESRQEVKQRLEDGGLRLCALMADLRPEKDPAAHLAELESLKRMIELAHNLAPGDDDPPLIQTILGGKQWDESRNLFRDRLANWNQLLADQKGHLSIKPHRSHAMSTPGEAAWLFEQLGNPPRLRMVYDYSHYAYRGPELDLEETIRTALPITNYVAVKDAVKNEADGKVRFALAGESGTWDLAAMFRGFLDGGYHGDFCAEVSSQIWRNQPDYDAKAATRTCYQNLRQAYEKAGAQ